MSDKITLQSIAEIFSQSCGVPKKSAEQLARAFFDTIIEGLAADESVRINGLGTFRVIDVASRESINVTNGERILIAGYRKVSFVPEDGVLQNQDSENGNTSVVEGVSGIEEHSAETAVEVVNDLVVDLEPVEDGCSRNVGASADFVQQEIDTIETPSRVELKEDEFSGIDILIATPESIEEIRLNLEAARIEAARKLKEAKDAHREVLRLEALLEKMEQCMIPEVGQEESGGQEEDAGAVEAEARLVAETVTDDDVIKEDLSAPISEDELSMDEVTGESVDGVGCESVADEPAQKGNAVEGPSLVESDLQTVQEDSAGDESGGFELSVPSGESVELSGEQSAVDDGNVVVEEPAAALDNSDKVVSEPAKGEKAKRKSPNVLLWVFLPMFLVLLLGCAFIAYKYHADQQKEELRQLPVKPKVEEEKPARVGKSAPVKALPDTVVNEENTVGSELEGSTRGKVPVTETKKTTGTKPSTYILGAGETLSKVSRKFYNTSDSVAAIIRINKFEDPDRVPIGTEIKLP